MSRTLKFHLAALEEFLETVNRYEQLRPGLGAAFLVAVQSAALHAFGALAKGAWRHLPVEAVQAIAAA